MQLQQVHIDYASWLWKSPPRKYDADKRDTFARRMRNTANAFKQRLGSHNYKHRFFVLDGSQLHYFRDDTLRELSGTVDLSTVSRVIPYEQEPWPGGPPYGVQLSTDARTFILVASDLDEQNEWLQRLSAIVRAGQRRGLLAKSLKGLAWKQQQTNTGNNEHTRETGKLRALEETARIREKPISLESRRDTVDGIACTMYDDDANEEDLPPLVARARSNSLVYTKATVPHSAHIGDVQNKTQTDVGKTPLTQKTTRHNWAYLSGNLSPAAMSLCAPGRLRHIPFLAKFAAKADPVRNLNLSNSRLMKQGNQVEITEDIERVCQQLTAIKSADLFRQVISRPKFVQAHWLAIAAQIPSVASTAGDVDQHVDTTSICFPGKLMANTPETNSMSDSEEPQRSLDHILEGCHLLCVPEGTVLRRASIRLDYMSHMLPVSSFHGPHLTTVILHGRIRTTVASVTTNPNTEPQEERLSTHYRASLGRNNNGRRSSINAPTLHFGDRVSRSSISDRRCGHNQDVGLDANTGAAMIIRSRAQATTHPYIRPTESGFSYTNQGRIRWVETNTAAAPIVLDAPCRCLLGAPDNDVVKDETCSALNDLSLLAIEIVATEPSFILTVETDKLATAHMWNDQDLTAPPLNVMSHRLRATALAFQSSVLIAAIPSFFAAFNHFGSDNHRLHDSDGQLAALLPYLGKFVHLQPGDVLYELGDWGDCCYVVLQGRLALSVMSPSTGKDILLSVRHPGTCLGEASLAKPASRSHTATAVTECVLYRFFHGSIKALMDQQPSLWRRITDAIEWRNAEQLVRVPSLAAITGGQGEGFRLAPLSEMFDHTLVHNKVIDAQSLYGAWRSRTTFESESNKSLMLIGSGVGQIGTTRHPSNEQFVSSKQERLAAGEWCGSTTLLAAPKFVYSLQPFSSESPCCVVFTLNSTAVINWSHGVPGAARRLEKWRSGS